MRPGLEQFTSQERLIGVENIDAWRARGRQLAKIVRAELQHRGYRLVSAPEMPPLHEVKDGCIEQPFRYLTAWIPDWAFNVDAGHFVIRVDTLARKADA
jgi:hypothetical protein